MKIVLSNDKEIDIIQANVRYADITDNENKNDQYDWKYPVVEFLANPNTFNASMHIENKDFFNEFTLHFEENKTKKFTGFELQENSIRESYSDLSSTVMFIASSK